MDKEPNLPKLDDPDNSSKKGQLSPLASKTHKAVPLREEKTDIVEWRDVVMSKKTWVLVVLLFFFLYFTTVVPVSNIPVLRSVAEAMGYSEEETHDLSFFKALLTWNEHSKKQKAERETREQSRKAVAASMAASAEETRLNKAQLVDLKAVNNARRGQGQQAETISRAAMANASQRSQVVAMSGNEQNVNTQQETARNLPGEVYFGSETDLVTRNRTDAFDSTKRLAAIQKPGIIDSKKSDWTLDAADSFWAHQGDIVFNNKLLNKSTTAMMSGQSTIQTVDLKPRMDMIYAWLTSRASRRTGNLMLKKTLSAASFMGADLDKPMLVTTVMWGGTPLETDKLQIDLGDAKKRAELEEECTKYLEEGSYKSDIIVPMQQIVELRDGLPGKFPAGCKEMESGGDAFNEALTQIVNGCNSVQGRYSTVSRICLMDIQRGKCDNGDLNSLVNTIKGQCDTYVQNCLSNYTASGEPTPQQKDECYTTATNMVGFGNFKNGNLLKEKIDAVMGEDSSYFPSVDWKGTLMNRKYGAISGGHSEDSE